MEESEWKDVLGFIMIEQCGKRRRRESSGEECGSGMFSVHPALA